MVRVLRNSTACNGFGAILSVSPDSARCRSAKQPAPSGARRRQR